MLCLRRIECVLYLSLEDIKSRSMLKERHCVCFVNHLKTCDGVPSNVMDWSVWKKAMPQVLVAEVICLYAGVKTRVRFD